MCSFAYLFNLFILSFTETETTSVGNTAHKFELYYVNIDFNASQ